MRVTPKSHGVRISIGFGLIKMMTLFSGFKAWRISILKIKPHIWSLQVPFWLLLYLLWFCGSKLKPWVPIRPWCTRTCSTGAQWPHHGFRTANTDLISARAVGHQRASSAWCSRPDVSVQPAASKQVARKGPSPQKPGAPSGFCHSGLCCFRVESLGKHNSGILCQFGHAFLGRPSKTVQDPTSSSSKHICVWLRVFAHPNTQTNRGAGMTMSPVQRQESNRISHFSRIWVRLLPALHFGCFCRLAQVVLVL